ncbi:MAG TPA: DUF4349 domain-containing protein [Phycisphaerae bacterium]|nr:DUF4349 domain-containing protein [Phycisphaerae bacterium]
MTGALDDNLEQQLAGLTVWPGDRTQLWRRALNMIGAGSATTAWDHMLLRPLSWKLRAGIAAAVILLVAAAVTMPHLSPGRRGSLSECAVPSAGSPMRYAPTEVADGRRSGTVGKEVLRAPAAEAEGFFYSLGTPAQPRVPSPGRPKQADQPVSDRHVIRKATIELKTDDVRAVFLKASMGLNAALGEYVEGSELTGTGKEAQAHLTLRVTAQRLDNVLNELRQLGEVRSERVEGQDVTAQVVDVEARLRNEQRVEAELLQLLEKRQDAPLKEVLELRDKIAEVREEIEKLTAQRDQLSRLVSLATVLVLIRPGDAPTTHESALGEYFARKFKAAWTDGVQFLADTLAALVSIIVGGLIWWVIAAVVIVAAYRWHRRKGRAG